MGPRYLPRGIDFHGAEEPVGLRQSTDYIGERGLNNLNVWLSPMYFHSERKVRTVKTAKNKFKSGLFWLMIQSKELYCHSNSYNHLDS
jgi:hypothetical protein